MSELSPIESLPVELLDLILDLLVYPELRAVGKASPKLSTAVADFFSTLRLALPDPARSSALQMLRGYPPNSAAYLDALGYMLHRGARVTHFTDPARDLYDEYLFHHSFGPWDATLRLLSTSASADLRSLVLSCRDGMGLAEQLALAASCPDLHHLRVQVKEAGCTALVATVEPFIFLPSLRQLRVLELRIPMDPAGLLSHVPLQQLRSLRLQMLAGGVQDLVLAWPALPNLEDLSFGMQFPQLLRLPWDKLPSLRSLEGLFNLGPDEAPPTLAALRRLAWGTGRDRPDVAATALCRFLAVTPALTDVSFSVQHLTPGLAKALGRLAGTLTRLEIVHGQIPGVLISAKIIALVARLPNIADLSLKELLAGFTCWESDPGFGYRAAAAVGTHLRRLTLHKRFYDSEARELDSSRQGADLLAQILSDPGRATGLRLGVNLAFEKQAKGLSAALAASHSDVASLVCVNWLDC